MGRSRRDPLTGAVTGEARARRASGGAVPSSTRRPTRRELYYPNVTARCGDGCLDRIVVSVRRQPTHTVAVRDGAAAFGQGDRLAGSGDANGHAQPPIWPNTRPEAERTRLPPLGAPLLLLGLLSGSAARREVLRCTWMRLDALKANGVRVLFIVGKDSAESSPDVLPVEVKEGAFMRSKSDKANQVCV